MAVFACPSDDVPAGATSYRGCTGTSPGGHGTIGLGPPDAALPGFFSRRGSRARDVTDGLSTTVFVSERLIGDGRPDAYDSARDLLLDVPSSGWLTPDQALQGCSQVAVTPSPQHASFLGYGWLFRGRGRTVYNHVTTPNSRIPDCTDQPVSSGPGAFTARSVHTGGVNALLGDGAARFVSESIDLSVWRALGTIRGGETVPQSF